MDLAKAFFLFIEISFPNKFSNASSSPSNSQLVRSSTLPLRFLTDREPSAFNLPCLRYLIRSDERSNILLSKSSSISNEPSSVRLSKPNFSSCLP